MKHIVFTGPRDSGKSTHARRLAKMFAEPELIADLTPDEAMKRAASYIIQKKEVFIIDECPDSTTVAIVASYIQGISSDVMLIFTSQQDCSSLDPKRFRVLSTDKEYFVKAITMSSDNLEEMEAVRVFRQSLGDMGKSTDI